MATATHPRAVQPIPAESVPAIVNPEPVPIPEPGDSPNMQEALAGSTSPTAPETTGDANTVEFSGACQRLETIIRTQSAALLGYYVARGAIVAEGIDIKLAKSRNAKSRKDNRAAALRAMELVALHAYDTDSEPQPLVDRWNVLHHLTALFPAALGLGSVRVAVELSKVITRIDPPASWDAPESWELKRQYAPATVREMIDRAVSENWTRDQMTNGIAALDGEVKPEPIPARESVDPVANAKSLATRIMGDIRELKVDPATLIEELVAQMDRFGLSVRPGRAPNGAEHLTVVKVGR
jgi:hypothetical protein